MKLSKAHRDLLKIMIAKLRYSQKSIEPAIQAYNDALAEAHDALLAALDPYNASLSCVEREVRRVGDELLEDFDDKSEKWKGSEKGIVIGEAISRFETFTLDSLEVKFPEQLEEAQEHSATVEELIEEDEEDEEEGVEEETY